MTKKTKPPTDAEILKIIHKLRLQLAARFTDENIKVPFSVLCQILAASMTTNVLLSTCAALYTNDPARFITETCERFKVACLDELLDLQKDKN